MALALVSMAFVVWLSNSIANRALPMVYRHKLALRLTIQHMTKSHL
jgi:hypothetical protein